uniref:Uncharacterized protein n=1 Tax=Ditylum brightwellii TaxID=49249 RepID=A0A7S4S188_9STRA|mmetsp:Transcript_2659/g.2977  ORF Transcript_2659/g.2977 Transcript_2659/m.2977 type:complete len:226 (+) Transcript_2659:55-732(+)
MTITDSEIFGKVALPAIIAFLTAGVGAFFRIVFYIFSNKSDNRKAQLERAQKIHDDVIHDIDALYSRMKHQAVYIAYNKAMQPKKTNAKDEEIWCAFRETLLRWNKSDVSRGSEVENYFCKSVDWRELRNCKELFDAINADFRLLSERLEKLYHADTTLKFIVLEEGTFRPSYKEVEKDWLEKELHFEEFNAVEDNLLQLSNQMTRRIQESNVGDLNVKRCCNMC